MNRPIIILLFAGIILSFTSCGVNSYVMFKSSDNEVITDNIPIAPTEEYRLAKNDKISLKLYVEDGARVIDFTAGISMDGNNMQMTRSTVLDYTVRPDGTVELPVVGLVELEGLSIIEAQEKLKVLYAENYIDPFIQVEVTNRRVIVFPGSGGSAKVVPITNENTTLMEALALAGGITERGKAKMVKVMRQTEEGREVYQVDMSTIDGLIYADMIVQANDYIYVEPTKQLSREFLKEVTPIISLISSAALIITLIMSFN